MTDPEGKTAQLRATTEESLDRMAFLANLRHELRTPLNAIIGYSEMWLEEAPDLDQPALIPALEQIHAAGRQLLEKVNTLLAPAQFEANRTTVNLEALWATLRRELQAPLHEILDSCDPLSAGAAQTGKEDFISDLQKIQAAARRFQALIDDLAGPAGGQAPATEPSPARDDSALARQALSTMAALAREETGIRGTILVVDDNESNRDLLSRSLERQGHLVRVAADGRQALEMIGASAFDLVLLDIMMPGLNGYQVLQHLKSDATQRDLPVIMISALDEMDSVVRCIELGAEDYLPKPFDPVLLRARIGACLEKKRLRDLEKEQQERVNRLNRALELRNRFIRETFGRYLSDEVVSEILETPGGLKIGGEKRLATILMSDLRGFTSLAERLPAEDVVAMVNIYLETMTEIILKFGGTINEFLGDGILVMFGAPVQRPDDARRAVACALEMQLAMAAVNVRNRQAGYPEVAMGIGINTGDVVVGNLGSEKRTAYGMVGRHVNLASRIESFTVGGQIFLSEGTMAACGPILRIDGRLKVMPKGVKQPITIFEVGGIAGDFNIFLPEKRGLELRRLRQPLAIQFAVLDGKSAGEEIHAATLVRLNPKAAEILGAFAPPRLSDVKIALFDYEGRQITGDLYAKVSENLPGAAPTFRANFTFVPPEAAAFFAEVSASNPPESA